MVIATFIMCCISMLWGISSAISMGVFGLKAKRRYKYLLTDRKSSEQLIRILERFKCGEFTVDFSICKTHLIFTKVEHNKHGILYNSQVILVQIEDPLSLCFGWLSNKHHTKTKYERIYSDGLRQGRAAISFEAWKMLMDLVCELKEEPPVSSRIIKRKNKKEVVNLS